MGKQELGETPTQCAIRETEEETGIQAEVTGILGVYSDPGHIVAYTDGQDHTCNNWTSNGTGRAQLGHFDRTGGGNTSWNSAHPSRGCSQPDLVATGGAGKFYCFAIN